MSTLLNPRMLLAITGALSDGLAPPVVTASINHTVNPSLPVGSGSGSVNHEYHTPVAVTSGSPLVLDLTNSAFWLGVVGFAGAIPFLFFTLFGFFICCSFLILLIF